MKKALAFVAILAMALVAFSPIVSVGEDVRVLIGFEDKANEKIVEAHGGKVEKKMENLNIIVADIKKSEINELIRESAISYVELDGIVKLSDKSWLQVEDERVTGKPPSRGGGDTPPPQVTPWGISRIGAPDVWATNTGSGVKVAVVDTGIDLKHSDLSVKGGRNFVWEKGFLDPNNYGDANGHGTHVAGTVAALNNAVGVVGAGPDVSLYSVRVLDRNGAGTISGVVSGIDWSVSNGMNVISMSLGTSADYQSMRDAVNRAHAAGVVVVAAAGNSGDGNTATTELSYPAAYDVVIAVGATDSNNNLASWSNTGSFVDFAAPGVSIYSTYKGNKYATLSGTSMATPHVSATVALVLRTSVGAYDLNLNGAWDPDEVKQKLINTATDLGPAGFDNGYGNGLVNALGAGA